MPVPTVERRLGALEGVAEIGFGSGPTTIQRYQPDSPDRGRRRPRPGLVDGDVWPKINELPTMKNLPQGVEQD